MQQLRKWILLRLSVVDATLVTLTFAVGAPAAAAAAPSVAAFDISAAVAVAAHVYCCWCVKEVRVPIAISPRFCCNCYCNFWPGLVTKSAIQVAIAIRYRCVASCMSPTFIFTAVAKVITIPSYVLELQL